MKEDSKKCSFNYFYGLFLVHFYNYIMLVKKIKWKMNTLSHGSFAIVEGVAFKIGLVDGN